MNSTPGNILDSLRDNHTTNKKKTMTLIAVTRRQQCTILAMLAVVVASCMNILRLKKQHTPPGRGTEKGTANRK